MSRILRNIWTAFTRRKPLENDSSGSELNRCLGIVDLTALGIGSTLGVGVYVITGTVAAKLAGPSVILSFAIAAVSSIFAGLCYAEFGALVPKAGSAYIYSYISVGEFMAFVIGWNLILEYVIGTASVARAYSNYLDYMFDNKIRNFLSQYLSLPESTWFSSYPDLFAFSLTMALTMMLLIGVKESTRFTTIFTGVNILVIIYVVIVGLFRIDTHNWAITEAEIPENVRHKAGHGGFMPFGVKGLVSGAATCFYSFVGFDAIATTGEEVINPQRDIPIGVILSLTIVSIAYCSVAAIQTLLWPYWDQNQGAPLPYVFDKVGFPFARHVITIGALAGLSTSLIGAMFPLPRVLYAMGSDGLIFKSLAKISARFKTPALATFLSGLFSAAMATFFDVDELAEMMSIGTLLAYSLVAISVMILRYQKENTIESGSEVKPDTYMPESSLDLYSGSFLSRVFNTQKAQTPNVFSSKIANFSMFFLCLLVVILNGLLLQYEETIYVATTPIYAVVMFAVVILLMIGTFAVLWSQPMKLPSSGFSVPWVPLIPFLSIFSNTYLMIHLNVLTWYRFLIWMFVGLIIYFFYGMVKSVGYLTADEKKRLCIHSPNDSAPMHQD